MGGLRESLVPLSVIGEKVSELAGLVKGGCHEIIHSSQVFEACGPWYMQQEYAEAESLNIFGSTSLGMQVRFLCLMTWKMSNQLLTC